MSQVLFVADDTEQPTKAADAPDASTLPPLNGGGTQAISELHWRVLSLRVYELV